jgi:Flp pilus assembly protein TadD
VGYIVANSLPARRRRFADIAATALADTLSTLTAEALASHRAGRLAEAAAHYQRILALQPALPQVHNNLGLALAELGRLDEAVQSYQRASALHPDDPETLCNWGCALAQLERGDEAEAKFRRAIAVRPGFAGAYNNLGLVLKDRGRLLDAQRALEQAICLSPKNASYYDNLAAIQPFAAADRYLTALESLAADAASLSPLNQMHLHFALAKVYEHLGGSERAFGHLSAANALKRAQIAYDEAATLAQMDRARALFTGAFISDREGAGDPSAVPVFIIGMPRSGTTLIEQILASHSEIFAAGELSLFEQTIDGIRNTLALSLPFPDMASSLSHEHCRTLGATYVEKLVQRAPGAARITDKMPANFLFAGLIHLALPQARIIHAVRDPLDTCVSCFSVHFTKGQMHTYDLAELGRYYRHYRALMAHWHRVLPPGRILDVHYEELVGNLEGAARRIIAHCALDWDARCLEFHRTERAVRTASATQVRQPIYTSAVGRWRRYEKFLGPLFAALDVPIAYDGGNASDSLGCASRPPANEATHA